MANRVLVLSVQGAVDAEQLISILRSMPELHSWQIILPNCALMISPQSVQQIAASIRNRVPGYQFLISEISSAKTDGYLPASAWEFVNYPEALAPQPDVTRLVVDRVSQATQAVSLEGRPSFALAAMPLAPVNVPTLFASRRSDLATLLSTPPSLRRDGFGLETGREPQNISGQFLRALIPEWKNLEFWRDGFLVFVADGADDFLCWASRGRKKELPLRINPLVLLEATLLFAELYGKLLSYMDHRPSQIQFLIALQHLTEDGKRLSLTPGPLGPYDWHGDERKEAPDNSVSFVVPWNTGKYDAGQVAFSLVSRVYEWFGFTHEDTPYCVVQEGVGSVRGDLVVGAVKSRN